MDAARQLAQLRERLRELVAGGHDERLGGAGSAWIWARDRAGAGCRARRGAAARRRAGRARDAAARRRPLRRCAAARRAAREPRLGLGVELLVLDGDGGRGAHRVDELGVVVERRVVDEQRGRSAVDLDRRRRTAGRRRRERRPAVRRARRRSRPAPRRATTSSGSPSVRRQRVLERRAAHGPQVPEQLREPGARQPGAEQLAGVARREAELAPARRARRPRAWRTRAHLRVRPSAARGTGGPHLAVRVPVGDQPGDLQLLRRERARPCVATGLAGVRRSRAARRAARSAQPVAPSCSNAAQRRAQMVAGARGRSPPCSPSSRTVRARSNRRGRSPRAAASASASPAAGFGRQRARGSGRRAPAPTVGAPGCANARTWPTAARASRRAPGEHAASTRSGRRQQGEVRMPDTRASGPPTPCRWTRRFLAPAAAQLEQRRGPIRRSRSRTRRRWRARVRSPPRPRRGTRPRRRCSRRTRPAWRGGCSPRSEGRPRGPA